MITGEQVYLPAFKSGQTHLSLEGSEFHHLIRVRRFGVDAQIWVVNGQGHAGLAEIDEIQDAKLSLKILEEYPHRGEHERKLVLAVANLKGDHLNLIVEKATELGVTEIAPLLTAHTVKRGINQSRLERIAIAAMKQSRRSLLPKIHELSSPAKFAEAHKDGFHLFCHADEKSVELMQLDSKIRSSNPIVIWIGPEGDWSKDEIDLASVSDYTFTGLGPRRLRAETAAIHAVGVVSALLQDSA